MAEKCVPRRAQVQNRTQKDGLAFKVILFPLYPLVPVCVRQTEEDRKRRPRRTITRALTLRFEVDLKGLINVEFLSGRTTSQGCSFRPRERVCLSMVGSTIRSVPAPESDIDPLSYRTCTSQSDIRRTQQCQHNNAQAKPTSSQRHNRNCSMTMLGMLW